MLVACSTLEVVWASTACTSSLCPYPSIPSQNGTQRQLEGTKMHRKTFLWWHHMALRMLLWAAVQLGQSTGQGESEMGCYPSGGRLSKWLRGWPGLHRHHRGDLPPLLRALAPSHRAGVCALWPIGESLRRPTRLGKPVALAEGAPRHPPQLHTIVPRL